MSNFEIQYDLRTGYPDLSIVPKERLSQIAAQVIQSGRGLQYGSDLQGILPVRERVAGFLTGMYSTSIEPDELMITSGTLAGIDVVCRTMTRPGDVVVVENPTFFYVVNLLQMSRVEVVGVPVGADGIDLQRLEALAQQYGDRLRMVYVIPAFQNPTGVCATAENRAELVRLAAQYDFYLAEDATYQPLYFNQPPPPPLKQFDAGRGRVFTMSSVSKILMPALRMGWIWAQPEQVVACKSFKGDAAPSLLTSQILADFIESGEFPQQVERARDLYRHKYQLMLNVLDEHLPDWLEWNQADGGFFVWARLPEDLTATQVREATRSRGVDFMRGTVASIDPPDDRYLRLCFAMLPDDELRAGARLFSECLKSLKTRAQVDG
jgi:DNA-binding transcriptional MocR family regulator